MWVDPGRALHNGRVDFDELADGLYAVPPAEFIAARADAVAQARRSDKALARQLGELGKPTLAAWTVNTLVRAAGEQVQELVGLGELMRQAQGSLDPGAMRELSTQRQQVVRALAREAARLARRAGHPVSEQVTAQVEETLRAAVADPAAGEAVLGGRLTGSLSYNGLGTPETSAPSAVPPRRPTPPPARRTPAEPESPPVPPVDLEAARTAKAERVARREAEERLRQARATLRAARTTADEAAEEAEQAVAAAREADRAADQSRRARDDAQARVRELTDQLASAQEVAERTAGDVVTAEESAERAGQDRDTALADAGRAAEDRDLAQRVVDELS